MTSPSPLTNISHVLREDLLFTPPPEEMINNILKLQEKLSAAWEIRLVNRHKENITEYRNNLAETLSAIDVFATSDVKTDTLPVIKATNDLP